MTARTPIPLTSRPRSQITFDLQSQVPPNEILAVRNQILELLQLYASGPKPIRVQLCVCLAILAIQMLDWKDVLPVVVSSLGNQVESHACILDFLRVLPEEVTEGRKITLTVRGSNYISTTFVLLFIGGAPRWTTCIRIKI